MTTAKTDIKNACVIGASGGIGRALVDLLCEREDIDQIYALSRGGDASEHPKVTTGRIDILDEASVNGAADNIDAALDLIIVATGILHEPNGLDPEKTYRAIDPLQMARVMAINTIGPALVAKHFLPKLRPASRCVFAALSARVGSISDNRLGGWYSYRASKAALNMVLRTLAIEVGRRHRQAIIAGLHPGTVDSNLSAPFQGNVPEGKLFTPNYSATALLAVLDKLTPEVSGNVWDFAGQRVAE